jgi:diguanylate cyclase (GGDEF)-like protein
MTASRPRLQGGSGRRPDSDDPDRTGVSSPGRRRPLDAWRISLVVVAHPDAAMLGRNFELSRGESMTIGRSPRAELSLPDRSDVSRRHARLWEEGGVVRVEDLRSRNGTLVNGEPVVKAREMVSGDTLQIGSVYLKFFAGQHVERAYYDAMYELASRDELTGAFNRRKLDEELEREFALARRYRRPVSLALLDIDRLKSINDRHGHRAGDSVLRQIAALVGRNLRRETLFARLGGDEFAVLCPETNAAAAQEMVGRLRALIEGHSFEVDGAAIAVSCSFGVAEAEREMTSAGDLYQAADAALYSHKPVGAPTLRLAPAGLPSRESKNS